MDKNFDIYGMDSRLEGAIHDIKNSKEICKKNKGNILEFSEHCFAEGLSKARIEKYTRTLGKIAILLEKPFTDAIKKDIEKLVAKIEKKDYSDWTKKDYKVALKKFYKWFRDSEEYPEEVRWIKTTILGVCKIRVGDFC